MYIYNTRYIHNVINTYSLPLLVSKLIYLDLPQFSYNNVFIVTCNINYLLIITEVINFFKENYRPISITYIMSKIFKKFVAED